MHLTCRQTLSDSIKDEYSLWCKTAHVAIVQQAVMILIPVRAQIEEKKKDQVEKLNWFFFYNRKEDEEEEEEAIGIDLVNGGMWTLTTVKLMFKRIVEINHDFESPPTIALPTPPSDTPDTSLQESNSSLKRFRDDNRNKNRTPTSRLQ